MKPDSTAFGAFALLKDGYWHSDVEIMQRCGQSGVGCVRSLRMAEYGSLDIVLARPKDLSEAAIAYTIPGKTYYRINGRIPNDVWANLTRRKSFPVDPMTYKRTIRLSGVDVVYMLAALDNDPQLADPQINSLWLERRVIIADELRKHVPVELRRPSDLLYVEDDA